MKKNKLFLAFALLVFSSSQTLAQAPQNLAAVDKSKIYKLNSNKVDSSDKSDNSSFYNIAVIQGLNKTTAKTSILEIKIGDRVRFGNLIIVAHKCWQPPLDQKPESKILLEVFEEKSDEDHLEEMQSKNAPIEKEKKEVRIFYGWIFASAPSVSGLEHPIYDLTALSCKK